MVADYRRTVCKALEGVAHAADFPLAEAAFALHLAQRVGQVVEVGDGSPEGAFDELDLVEGLLQAGFFPIGEVSAARAVPVAVGGSVLHGGVPFFWLVVLVDGFGLIRRVGGRCRGDGADRRGGRGTGFRRGDVGIDTHGHDDHLAAAAIAEAQGLERLLHADLAQAKADGLEQVLPVDVHRGGIAADRDAGHLDFGGAFLVFVGAAQVQPAADGVQTYRVVGRVVSRQPGHDAPDRFRRLIADLDGAAKLAHIVGDVAPVGVRALDLLGDERPAAAFQLEVAALVLRGRLHGELPLAVLDEAAPGEEAVIGDRTEEGSARCSDCWRYRCRPSVATA